MADDLGVSDSVNISALQPVSLDKLVSHARNAKGIPPKSLKNLGVACLHPNTMQSEGYKVLDIGVFQEPNSCRCVLASLWPLQVVDEGFVAFDEHSILSLGLDLDNALIRMPSMQTPRKSRNKKGKKGTPSRKAARDQGRHHRADIDKGDILETNSLAENLLKINLIRVVRNSSALEARTIHLQCDDELEFMLSEECNAMLHACLLGKAVMSEMVVPMSLFGESILLKVLGVDEDFRSHENCKPGVQKRPIYICTRETVVESVLSSQDLYAGEIGHYIDLGDLAGLDRQVREAQSILEAGIRSRGKDDVVGSNYAMLAMKPRGLLIHGPSGTGKTMMACALANSYNLNLEVISGPEVLGKSTSDALRTIENCFKRAGRKGPSLVLLDELDALAPRRDLPALDDLQRKLTAALLTIIDSQNDSEVVIVGTTNRLDLIDAAMRRPGRFDYEVEVTVPNAAARVQILKKLVTDAATDVKVEVSDEDLEKIAVLCYGYVGADIASLWREAVSAACDRESPPSILEVDFKEALKRVHPSALREIAVEIPTTKWSDVGGKEEAKQRLQEAVEWPLNENGSLAFSSFGVTPPRGILLYGPPGCSKTLLARAVATESKANFISVKGAELLSKWVGESEKAVRNIFRRARQAAPCVIFFDEIDALATSRSFVAGASAQARVVAQLLSEMDGIDTFGNNRVVVIAATNRPDCLDSAFLRPGRIDVQIYIGLPDHGERLSILQVHTRKVPLAEDVDLEEVARCTDAYSGAEVAAVVREAALCAMEHDVDNASVVSARDFNTAMSKVYARTPASVLEYFESYKIQLQKKLFSVL
eukprot:TRINITY_DN284_c0_g1_i1.p1 TRINITY_DN284_c0_g1~~TRINITY_DN284_c0_g1_i1.p1  ORF type:complete len:822 (-),score=105.54 TRINITY_DN284_c0_g1_i1:3339-5804(-)